MSVCTPGRTWRERSKSTKVEKWRLMEEQEEVVGRGRGRELNHMITQPHCHFHFSVAQIPQEGAVGLRCLFSPLCLCHLKKNKSTSSPKSHLDLCFVYSGKEIEEAALVIHS